MSERSPLRVGIGGPVGSGKTALTLNLCFALREKYNMAVVTNDIYTKEDSNFLTRHEAMSPDRIVGVETGGCPHTAIREDASINLAAIDDLPRIVEIYNQSIAGKQATADLQPVSVADRQAWFDAHTGNRPLVVAQTRSENSLGEIVGWGSLSD